MRFKKYLVVSLLFLAACEPSINSRGNVIAVKQVDAFVIGKTTMEEVLRSCGTPPLLKDNFTWIYVGGRSEEVSFQNIEVKDRSIVKLFFDKNRILKDKVVTVPTNVNYDFDEGVTSLISKQESEALLKKSS